MNCEEFRQRFDAAPTEEFDGREEHLADCDDCSGAVARAQAFESVLSAAMAVPVPDMPMPIVGEDQESANPSNVVSIERARPRRLAARSGLWLAAAASITLAIGVGTKVLGPATSGTNENNGLALAAEVLEHMQHEPYALVVSQQAVAEDRLANVTHAANTDVDDQLGLVSYVSSCEINGQSIPHLVVQGKAGPVTILILPNETINAPVALDNDTFHGTIIPVGRKGSVAIIGRKGESIDDIRDRVRDSIRLSI